MILIYDTLLWSDATGQMLPWLASGFQRSPDGLSYRFELRDNVRWHDGRPFTSDDVVFSFEYLEATKDTVASFIKSDRNLVSVAADGPRAVRFQLKEPLVTWERAVAAGTPIIPRHIWSTIERPGEAQDPAVLVGTGPYRLESYGRGEGTYLYAANDDFFLGKPFVKRLELTAVGDDLNALRAGEIDAGAPASDGAPVSAALLKPFRANPAFGILEGPADFPAALYWNLEKGGVLADVRFRRACAMAIDRRDLVKRVLGGAGAPGNPGFLPAGHPFRVDVEQYDFDPAAANRLLDKAGYTRKGGKGTRRDPDGRPLRFKTLVLPPLAPVLELVVDALGRIGVDLDVVPVDFVRLVTGTPDYEMALLFYAGISDDPDYMRGVYSSQADKGFLAARGYRDLEMDDLAGRQRVAFDEGERKKLIARMQEIAARDLPLLHLYYTTGFWVYKRSVFDQWAYNRFGGGPLNKQTLATGLKAGTDIRPSPEGT
jgi:peptide/nickel transport system substrate-binding protein